MKPYDYQENIIANAQHKLTLFDSVLVQSATGSGKTVIMSFFIKEWLNNNDGIVLVSVHREELVEQTSKTLAKLGILNEWITSKSKNEFNSRVYVGMTQTIWSRKTNLKVDLMIIDEAHEAVHDKTFDFFKNAKRLGFTATPIRNKRRSFFKCEYCGKKSDESSVCCFSEKMDKYSEPITMSEIYDDIVVGPEIKTLISQGALVDELVFTYNYYENLKPKGDDEFDENEIAEESIKHDQNVLDEYLEKAKGKKTMIFTASTKQNVSLLETFKDYPVRSYDTVNENEYNRKEVVDWFRATEGAVLISTGTFTTGFDVKEVECIIVNRPIQSLPLWLQIVGRGARTTDKFYKDTFILIDLGGNVNRLGKWSDPIDWESIFFKGLNPPRRSKPKLIQCDKCGYNFVGFGGDECEDCGHVNKPITYDNVPLGGDDLETERVLMRTSSVSVLPMPNGRKIAEYVKRTTDSKNDYWKIIIDKYVDLWKYNNVSSDIYFQRVENGRLEEKIMDYLRANYGFVNMISGGVPRTYNYLTNKIKLKLSKLYSKNTV